MSAKPEIVIHIAGAAIDGVQRCLDCGAILWDERISKRWLRGDRVAVRIDETPKDGWIIGYWEVASDAPLADDQRRCTVRE